MKKIEITILKLAEQNLKLLKYSSYILNCFALIVLILWLLKLKVDYFANIELEALVVILSGSVVSLNQINRKLLEKIDYSPADALAFGYVNNFLLPAITQLKENGEVKPVLFIYKPEKISELIPSNIDIIKAELRNKSYSLGEINLAPKSARSRDVLTIQKNPDKQVYFDFPNTLLSLLNYIDYKIESKENNSNKSEKEELGKKLISEFYKRVNDLAVEKRINNNLKYCDSKMKLF